MGETENYSSTRFVLGDPNIKACGENINGRLLFIFVSVDRTGGGVRTEKDRKTFWFHFFFVRVLLIDWMGPWNGRRRFYILVFFDEGFGLFDPLIN